MHLDDLIVGTVKLIDELDKGINIYGMKVREWYGCNFPELPKIAQENILCAKAIKLMGDRTRNFSEILPDEVEVELKKAAMISMGTAVSDIDITNIQELCDQVLYLAEYRAQLYKYLENRMNTVAPNLTALVGVLVSARLITHGGGLLNLSKLAGCTIQILGVEKAIVRGLKTEHTTPKYGIIYHAPLVSQAARKHKRKISRSLAAKAVLAIRCDALGSGQDNTVGVQNRLKLEAYLRYLEAQDSGRGSAKTCNTDAEGEPKTEEPSKKKKKRELETETKEEPQKKKRKKAEE